MITVSTRNSIYYLDPDQHRYQRVPREDIDTSLPPVTSQNLAYDEWHEMVAYQWRADGCLQITYPDSACPHGGDPTRCTQQHYLLTTPVGLWRQDSDPITGETSTSWTLSES